MPEQQTPQRTSIIDTIGNYATGGIGSAAGAAMGLILGGINDRRQLKQQGKLGQQQLELNKQATDYNYSKQLEMWKQTNYPAQMEQMKKAGLNAGLLYGMGGAGGALTGSGGQSVSAAQAPSGGGEAMGLMQQGIQMQLLKAQKDNIEADTQNKLAEATLKGGAQTDLMKAQTGVQQGTIANLAADTTNKEAQKIGITLDNRLKDMEYGYQSRTLEDRIELFGYDMKKAFAQVELLQNEAYVSRNTMDLTIQEAKARLAGILANNVLTGAKTKETQANTSNIKKDTELKGSQIGLIGTQQNVMIQKMMQDWDRLGLDQKEMRLQEQITNWNTDYTREMKNDVINIIDAISGLGKKGTQPIGGFQIPQKKY